VTNFDVHIFNRLNTVFRMTIVIDTHYFLLQHKPRGLDITAAHSFICVGETFYQLRKAILVFRGLRLCSRDLA